MGHAIRALADANPVTTVLSIGGIGAYDHVHRRCLLKKLHSVPGLKGYSLRPRNVRQPTSYVWVDEAGVPHRIVHAEGGEQGDHDPLQEASRKLSQRNTSSHSYPNSVRQPCIRLHTDKTRVWNRASVCPVGMADLGPDVWNPEGVKVLGTPVRSRVFVHEVKLWDAIPWVPNPQAPWQMLLQCAAPRFHHILLTLPPSQSADYAQGHDEGMKQTMDRLLGLPGEPHEQELDRPSLETALPSDSPSPAPPSTRPPSAGPPFCWSAENFALPFLSPTTNFVFSSLSGGLFVELWPGRKWERERRKKRHFGQSSGERSGGGWLSGLAQGGSAVRRARGKKGEGKKEREKEKKKEKQRRKACSGSLRCSPSASPPGVGFWRGV